MNLSKENMIRNMDDMVDFARSTGNPFYDKALAEFDTAMEVLQLAIQERDQAFLKLAMQVKLADSEEYTKVGLDHEALEGMDPGQAILYLMSKGKFKVGQTKYLIK